MSTFKNNAEVEVRERRLHSVLSYHGSAKDLYEKSKKRELKNSGKCYAQCGDCAEGCAETIINHIHDTAVINHAPVGCAVNASQHNLTSRVVSEARGLPINKVQIINTNIQEKDTVYGASEKLRKAIFEADKRFKPKAIFISASCASGIIGEDIESVANETESELGYPVVPIYCEGFKAKIWSTGFDAAFHGLLRKIIKAPKEKKNDVINVFNFEGSDTFIPFLKKLNLKVNYVVPLTSLEELERITEAACNATICETLSTYVSASLEEMYGIPEVKAPAPFGINWTDEWIREIAMYTNREELAEQVIEEGHEAIKEELNQLRNRLKGKKLYVISGDSFAHNIANVGKDLGLEIIGANTLHHDQHTDVEGQPNTLNSLIESNGGDIPNFSVCNKQPYQLIKILQKLKPDIVIVRHNGLTTLATRIGIPVILEGDANYSIGYEGVIRMGRRIDEAIRTRKLALNIAKHSKLPYTKWWLEEENPFYFEEAK